MHEDWDQRAFVGYYSGAWLWPDDEIGWVKTVLPFFDKISLIMPAELLPRVLDQDPVLAQPLYDMGILVNREPKDVLDVKASAAIAEAIREEVDSGGFEQTAEANLITYEHLGRSNEARRVLAALQARGLAGTVGDDGLFRINPDLQKHLLAVCAQTMCWVDRAVGRDAVPFRAPKDERLFYEPLGPWPSDDPARQLTDDIEAVGADLSHLPLDEVLDIRKTNGSAYRAYLRNLRSFAQSLPVDDYAWELNRAIAERREEIQDAASDLRRKARLTDLKQNLSVSLGFAGAMWTANTGNYVGAALAAAGAAVGLIPGPQTSSAYSYLFRVADSGR